MRGHERMLGSGGRRGGERKQSRGGVEIDGVLTDLASFFLRERSGTPRYDVLRTVYAHAVQYENLRKAVSNETFRSPLCILSHGYLYVHMQLRT